MSSLQTPLHKVQGLGASHSGTGHFWRQRITALALVPLGLWFAFAVLGMVGTNEVVVLSFLAHPGNALNNTMGVLDPDTGAAEEPLSPTELNAANKAISAANERAQKAIASVGPISVKRV